MFGWRSLRYWEDPSSGMKTEGEEDDALRDEAVVVRSDEERE